jgi:uroporphyrinogen decarboxylase
MAGPTGTELDNRRRGRRKDSVMKPRERVHAALQHLEPDRVPRFEIWIDAVLDELGQTDIPSAHVNLGQDCVMMPTRTPPESCAWKTGVDEWGRVWKDGIYVDGVVDTEADFRQYSPSLEVADQLFDRAEIQAIRGRYPDHCIIYGSHIGPFTAGYLAMGFERFFVRLVDDPAFVRQLLESRTEWCIAMFRKAVRLGAEVLVLGDDAGHQGGPMVSPRLWREFVLPLHRRIVDEADAPVLWHSDGNVRALLPMAVEAGFAGFHGLEPAAGMDLAEVKREFGQHLVLVGNIDVRLLCGTDLEAVRSEVRRCLATGAAGGGYMLATCNSIFEGMNPIAVAEMFRYEREVGFYA